MVDNLASPSNTLRGILREKRWSYSRLAVELRRQAALAGENLPKTESLVTLITRWVNNRQQPDEFYRELLTRALGTSRTVLFPYEPDSADFVNATQPWRLARALGASSITPAALDALEETVVALFKLYPQASPSGLVRPVLEHYYAIGKLLEGPLRVKDRRRLVAIAGLVAGLAGNLSFDLSNNAMAESHFKIALSAAIEAEDNTLAAWTLAIRSFIPLYTDDNSSALELVRSAQEFTAGRVTTTHEAWLIALEGRACAALGDSQGYEAAFYKAESAMECAQTSGHPLGIDFFDIPRLLAYKGTCLLSLEQPKLAQTLLSQVLTLRSPTDVKGRSVALLDLAASYALGGELEEACNTITAALAIAPEFRIGRIIRRAREVRGQLQPWNSDRAVRDLDEHLRLILVT